MRLCRVLLSLALFLPAFAVVFVSAAPAKAEPMFTFYRCYERDGYQHTVKRLDDCTYGTIVVLNSYTDKVQAQIDGFCARLAAIDGKSQSQIASQCVHKNRRLTWKQVLTITAVAVRCYATRKPSCLLPLLRL